MNAKQDRFIFKASLLSISLFLMMATQIASALPSRIVAVKFHNQANLIGALAALLGMATV